MKYVPTIVLVVAALLCFWSPTSARVDGYSYIDLPYELQPDHTLWGIPAKPAEECDLVFRRAYTLLANHRTKFADWVAFKLSADMMGGPSRPRNWQTDPWLASDETMWAESNTKHGMLGISRRKNGKVVAESSDLGHQANLSAFSNTDYWQETNYFSNITPQKAWLNEGIWEELEARIKELAAEEGPVWVFTGPIYYDQLQAFEGSDEFAWHKAYVERNSDWVNNPNFANGALNFSQPLPIPQADKEGVTYQVPAGYWKVVVVPDFEDPLKTWCASFIFGQDTPLQKSNIMPYLYNIDTVEKVAGIDLLWELDDATEDKLEHWYFNDTVEGKHPETSKCGLTKRYGKGGGD